MTTWATHGSTLHHVAAADPPLDPTGDEARSLLRRELLEPAYNDQNFIERLLRAIERRIGGGIDAASNLGPVPTLISMLLLVALIAALGYLLSRARRTARAARPSAAVLTEEIISAEQLRERAEEALTRGEYGAALLDAYRALAKRQIERGRLEDSPGATAHEVAGVLSEEYPQLRDRVESSADLFDLVLYGERPATREQAVEVLSLDDVLVGAR